ncbi:MAG: 1-acyl-sn-glycerol-3-phosphate acyltransferase [Victivallales bacterium]|nr:1-acyl-sn-glycerol-3-phosphate acyltransferase [Victivallales bacterium]
MYSALVHISVAASMAAYVCLVFIPYLLVLLLPKARRGHCMRFLTLGLGWTAVHIGIRPFVKVLYFDEAAEQDFPGIYVCNHRSASDAFLMSLFGKEAVQIVNGWPMRLPFFGFNARMSEYIDSTKIAVEDYPEVVRELLDKGVSVIAFPEGTRSESPVMNRFHSGIFHLAMELRVPVYPICISGNEHFPDRRFRFHKTRAIHVKRLPPIMPEEYQKFPTAYVFKKRMHDMIQQECLNMDRTINTQ